MLAFRADKKHRKRTIDNLKMAFPDWDGCPALRDRERRVPSLRPHVGAVHANVRSHGREHPSLNRGGWLGACRSGRSPRQGDPVRDRPLWELGMGWPVVRVHGRKLTVVQRDANQSGINDRSLKLREAAGLEVMSRGAAARGILVRLKRKEAVALLIDQNAGDVYVPFFGRPAGTVTGPAVIATRTGAPIVPGYAIRLGPGRYRVEFFPQIKAAAGEEAKSKASRPRSTPTSRRWSAAIQTNGSGCTTDGRAPGRRGCYERAEPAARPIRGNRRLCDGGVGSRPHTATNYRMESCLGS